MTKVRVSKEEVFKAAGAFGLVPIPDFIELEGEVVEEKIMPEISGGCLIGRHTFCAWLPCICPCHKPTEKLFNERGHDLTCQCDRCTRGKLPKIEELKDLREHTDLCSALEAATYAIRELQRRENTRNGHF